MEAVRAEHPIVVEGLYHGHAPLGESRMQRRSEHRKEIVHMGDIERAVAEQRIDVGCAGRIPVRAEPGPQSAKRAICPRS